MPQSTRLALPYLAAGQAQKHVTVNESLVRLDALVQLSARSASLAAQPASPGDGDIYILPAGKSGTHWGGMANGAIAYYRDGAWEEIAPKPGWRCYAEDENALLARTSSGWARIAGENEHRTLFTPGGDGVVSIYRIDTARVQNARTATIGSISGDTITLTANDAGLLFSSNMAGVSYVRIWNTSKTPDQSAWVKAAPAANQLRVVEAAAVAGWANGDTIQIGDPTDQTPNRVIALDISPMMQTVLGRTFRQAGVLAKMIVAGAGAQTQLDISEAGVSGSFQTTRSFPDGGFNVSQNMIPCSQPSPISNSNLVFVRETATGATMTTAGVWVLALLV